jgi:hypothetical protein
MLALAACGESRRDVPPWMRPAEKPRDENYRGGPVAMLLPYHKGPGDVLERKELVAALRSEFNAADARHAGCLDEEQTAVINQRRQDADQSTATPLIDWNRDGCIDFREFSAAPLSLFDQLDRNGDGKLTREEMGQKPGSQSVGQSAGSSGDNGEGRRRGPRESGSAGDRSDVPPPAVPN